MKREHERQGRNYPVAKDLDDPRFTVGLFYDVAEVLIKRRYPQLEGNDVVRLQEALLLAALRRLALGKAELVDLERLEPHARAAGLPWGELFPELATEREATELLKGVRS